MYHYTITVPATDNALFSTDLLTCKIKEFNSSENHLLFDGNTQAGKRFILICREAMNDESINAFNKLFETNIQLEEITAENADEKTIEKIRIIKEIMATGDRAAEFNKNAVYITETYERLLKERDPTRVSSQFLTFLDDYASYIDRNADKPVKAKYNLLLLHDSETDYEVYDHFELLFGILSDKKVLTEYAFYSGRIEEAICLRRDSSHLFYVRLNNLFSCDINRMSETGVEESILTKTQNDGAERLLKYDMADLITTTLDSNNIYVTSMTKENYEKAKKMDGFETAFPHVVTIGDFTTQDKVEVITNTAKEYGFTAQLDDLDTDGAQSVSALEKLTMKQVNIALHRAVQKRLYSGKLTADDTGEPTADDTGEPIGDFTITLSDLICSDDTPKQSALDELENMIGLSSVKRTIKEIVTLLKKRGKQSVPSLHMVLLGNPGTGKTTVARLIAKILAEIGITKKDTFVETQRGGLVGKYVGHTAAKTASVIHKALGGVLFIDEAYALISGGSEHSADAFGLEAISTLVKIMEDRRDEFVCIMAGYPEQMNEMLDVNPGLRDRISFYIDFPDYDVNELVEIFEALCTQDGYEPAPEAKALLKKECAHILGKRPQNFSNGRFIRKVFERMKLHQAMRASDDIITEDDIKAVFAEKDITAFTTKDKIVFGFQHSA